MPDAKLTDWRTAMNLQRISSFRLLFSIIRSMPCISLICFECVIDVALGSLTTRHRTIAAWPECI